MKKTFVILANSIRRGCRCIAGREMTEHDGQRHWGLWIRPVSQHGEGEISTQECLCSDGTQPAVLDIVEITLTTRQDCAYQPENFIIDPSCRWQKHGTIPASSLPTIEEEPTHLWLQAGAGRTDRIQSQIALGSLEPFQSLYLIRPTKLLFRIWETLDAFRGGLRKQRRAVFSYAGTEYNLTITDPSMEARYFRPFPPHDQPPKEIAPRSPENCLLVVSLAAPFTDGYHYKVVATVLEY